MISSTVRQPIRFGSQPDARHMVPAMNSGDKAVQLQKPATDKDLLVLSMPRQITLQFPHHDGQDKDTHVLNAHQAKVFQMLLTALATNNPHLLKEVARYSTFQTPAIRHSRMMETEDESREANSEHAIQLGERVRVNFLDGSKKGRQIKEECSRDGQVTVNIYNNPSNVQHNTQNNGQAGSLLNTLANVTPWGMAKVLGGTSLAVLGTYYLGPTVLNYAKNKLVGLVIPENLMTRTSAFVSAPLTWFRSGPVIEAATATANQTAATVTGDITSTVAQAARVAATPTITQAATETLAQNSTRILGESHAAQATGGILDGLSDGLSSAANVVGDIAAKGLNMGFNILNSPAMIMLPFFYSHMRRLRSSGSTPNMAPPPVYVYQETGRKTGKIQGNVHGFL